MYQDTRDGGGAQGRGLDRPQMLTQGRLDREFQGPTYPEQGLERGVQVGMSPLPHRFLTQ